MSIAAAAMSASSSCSHVLNSTCYFTPGAFVTPQIAGAAVRSDLAARPQNPAPLFRPLVATCRLPPPAAGTTRPFLSSARPASFLVSAATAATSYDSAASFLDDENYDDEEWQNGGKYSDSGDGFGEGFPKGIIPNEEKPKNKGGKDASRLFVGNLPYSMTEDQLAEVFREAGAVRSVEVVYDRLTDRSRGFAFITMAGVEEAEEAIRLFNGAQVGGRTVKVNFPEVPRGGEREVRGPRPSGSGVGGRRFLESPHQVYVGNLSWSVTNESLRRAMEGLPGFMSAKVLFEPDTGRSRGYGFAAFATPEDAQSAVDSMNGVEVEGRPLRLSLAISVPSRTE